MRHLRYLATLATLAATPLVAQTTATSPSPAPATVTPPKLDYDSLAFGRQLNNWFYSSEVDSLWAHTSPGFQQQIGTKDQWMQMIATFTERAGMEIEPVEDRWVKRNGKRQYWHIFRASEFTAEPVMLRWVLEPGKMVGGLGMNPLSQAPPVDP